MASGTTPLSQINNRLEALIPPRALSRMSAAFTYAYNRTSSVIFLADNMRNALRDVIRENGLSPQYLMGQWDQWVQKTIKTWASSGHLRTIVIEFYKPGTSAALARWDFPINYTGSGIDDDMWLDKAYLRQLIAKAAKPTLDCVYRILLTHQPNSAGCAGDQPLVVPLSVDGPALGDRSAGIIVATGHLTASATYWG